MAYRQLPRTIDAILSALRNAFNKAETFADKSLMAFSIDVYNRLVAFLPQYEREVTEMKTALAEQTGITAAKVSAFDRAAMFVSHFFQTFNNGVLRGMFPANHRVHSGIDANDPKAPVIKSEDDLQKWALNIKTGDAIRVAAGGKAMAMPTAAEVDTEFTAYMAEKSVQTGLKDQYDKEQEDVRAIYDEARLLVRDIWDDVEYKFRHDDYPSLRRKAREYGVVYIEESSSSGGEEPVVPITGTVASQSSALIKEGGFDANSLFIVTNTGTVPLKFYTAVTAADPVPGATVDLAPGIQQEIYASELGAETNTFFMVYNPNETIEGSWEMEMGDEE